MEIVVQLKVHKLELPQDYRRCFMSFLKHALTQYQGGDHFADFYGNNEQRRFCFGIVFDRKVTFADGFTKLDSPKVTMIIATTEMKSTIILFNSLLSLVAKSYSLGENILTVEQVKLQEQQMITSNAVRFKIVSPICLREHQREGNVDRYTSIASENFADILRESIQKELAKYDDRLVPLVDELKIDTRGCKKTVVVHYSHPIEVTIGEIGFYGQPQLLQAISLLHLGSRKGAGFGLIRILEQWEMI